MYISQTGPRVLGKQCKETITRSDRLEGSLRRGNIGDKDESLKSGVGGKAEEVAGSKVQSGKALAVFEKLKGLGSCEGLKGGSKQDQVIQDLVNHSE